MEYVTVRTYLEAEGNRRYGAHYERADGARLTITTGERGCQFAKDKASAALYECKWEPLIPNRVDGFIEVGHGWVDQSNS